MSTVNIDKPQENSRRKSFLRVAECNRVGGEGGRGAPMIPSLEWKLGAQFVPQLTAQHPAQPRKIRGTKLHKSSWLSCICCSGQSNLSFREK
jgi:hypothetical protein